MIDDRLSTRPLETVRIAVHGAAGRVGSRCCAVALDTPGVTLAAALVRAGSPAIGKPSAPGDARAPALISADHAGISAEVVVDFTSDAGAADALRLARRLDAALLVGTTALADSTVGVLRAAALERPVIVAPNTSLGVAVLAHLAHAAARLLGQGFDAAIVESHHAKKKDSPSGTALRLAGALRAAGTVLRDDQVVALRGGDVIGEHTIRLAGPGELIELTHRATGRDLFARGAIRGAAWLAGRPAGWYTIEDTLGLSPTA